MSRRDIYYQSIVLEIMEEDLISKMDILATELLKARENENTTFIMGNGGSASAASHFAGDLSKGMIVEGFPRTQTISPPNCSRRSRDNSLRDTERSKKQNANSGQRG